MRRRSSWLVGLVVALLAIVGCAEIGDLVEIVAFEESDDPELQNTGKVLREIKEEREMQDALDTFLETGDQSHLERARAIRPDDTAIAGYDAALATLSGDPSEIAAARRHLIEAEARRLAALQSPGDSPFTAEHIHRNALGEILVAQINLLGGSLTNEWNPPAADAPERTQQLYRDYCSTRREIQGPPYNDNLGYLPNPPCP